METCLMRGQHRPLRASHVIPDWYWRDEIRDLAHGGRFHDLSRMRTHGKAITHPLMCDDCEQRVGLLDNQAKRYSQDRPDEYGPWLWAFAASICWRVLNYHRLNPDVRDRHAEMLSDPSVPKALACWKDAVLHSRTTRRSLRHTLHVYHVHDSYLMRQVICTTVDRLVDDGDSLVVFSRFGPFAFIGVIHSRDPRPWQDSKSRVMKSGGPVMPFNAGAADVIRFLVVVERQCARLVKDFNERQAEAAS